MTEPSPVVALAIEHLSKEEGRVPYAYQDTLGLWTIGVGRLIDKRRGGHLRDCEIDFMLGNDIADRIDAMKDWPSWQRVRNDPVRAVAMISLAFQLGTDGLSKFTNTLRAISQGAWISAANGLRASLWAKQTPNRAQRVIHMIETGEVA